MNANIENVLRKSIDGAMHNWPDYIPLTKNVVSDEKFLPGTSVMMLDATRSSKWDPVYEGPFSIIRKNKGGAYILKDRLGETLKRAVPPDQLKLIFRNVSDTVIEETSYKIDKITDHRMTKKRKFEYYVTWKDKSIAAGWEPVENFDDVACIKHYWNSIRPMRNRKKRS